MGHMNQTPANSDTYFNRNSGFAGVVSTKLNKPSIPANYVSRRAIVERFEKRGLKIVGLKLIRANTDLIGRHYKHDPKWLESIGKKTKTAYEKKGVKINKTELQIGEDVRNMLLEYIGSGPVVDMR